MSGGVYTDKKEHWDFIGSAMRENIESNPLHFVEFAHVGQLEAEVIKMTLDAFHGPEGSCGVTSSGGTESIFLAMLAYREEGRKRESLSQTLSHHSLLMPPLIRQVSI